MKNKLIIIINLMFYIITYSSLRISHILTQPSITYLNKWELIEEYSNSYYSNYKIILILLLIIFIINIFILFKFYGKEKKNILNIWITFISIQLLLIIIGMIL